MKLFQLEAIVRSLRAGGAKGNDEVRVRTSENRPTRALTDITVGAHGVFLHAPAKKRVAQR